MKSISFFRARHRFAVFLTIGIVLISSMSCTRTMIVPDDEWEERKDEYNGKYIISTNDGRELNVQRFARTDSSVIVYNLKDDNEGAGELPLELPLSEIHEIKETKYWWWGTAIGLSVFSMVAYFAFLALLAYGLSNATF